MLKQKKNISKENNLTANHNSQNLFEINKHPPDGANYVINLQTNTQLFFLFFNELVMPIPYLNNGYISYNWSDNISTRTKLNLIELTNKKNDF